MENGSLLKLPFLFYYDCCKTGKAKKYSLYSFTVISRRNEGRQN